MSGLRVSEVPELPNSLLHILKDGCTEAALVQILCDTPGAGLKGIGEACARVGASKLMDGAEGKGHRHAWRAPAAVCEGFHPAPPLPDATPLPCFRGLARRRVEHPPAHYPVESVVAVLVLIEHFHTAIVWGHYAYVADVVVAS